MVRLGLADCRQKTVTGRATLESLNRGLVLGEIFLTE
jgi:hypothetical protein